MYVKQLSVFVENKFGRMAEILSALAKNEIDISALSLADTSEFGILRLIVDKPELAVSVLKEEGVIVKLSDVLAIAIDDSPGGLSKALDVLTEANVVIEYIPLSHLDDFEVGTSKGTANGRKATITQYSWKSLWTHRYVTYHGAYSPQMWAKILRLCTATKKRSTRRVL
jgi:hypothetical protein